MPTSNSKDKSKTPTTTIKIAAKEASQRNSAGTADPGPGDPSAAPSEAPQLVDIPDPPTPSELVVKSVTGKQSAGKGPSAGGAGSGSASQKPSAGYKSTVGASKSKSKLEPSGSGAGPAASNPSIGHSSAREPTSSKPLTGPTDGASGHHTASGSHRNSAPKSSGASPQAALASGAEGGAPSPSQQGPGEPANTASAAMQADSGAVHDEDEEGEGEVEQPATPGSPAPGASTGTSAGGSQLGGLRGTSQADGPASAGASGASSPQASTSGKAMSASSPASSPATTSPASATAASSAASSRKSSKSRSSRKSSPSSMMPSSMKDEASSSAPLGKDGKKVTKFRYHKRITVRTSGKQSPSAIMDKVNQKDHKAGITPSTIEEMDPQELMRRAGIKGTNKTHWRVRLRQTKRLTKNGKTVTQTKVAYRDSEGNKRVKTSSSPFCKNCGKKLEECKCETTSQNSQN